MADNTPCIICGKPDGQEGHECLSWLKSRVAELEKYNYELQFQDNLIDSGWISIKDKRPEPENEYLIYPPYETDYFYFTAYYGYQKCGGIDWEIEYDCHGATERCHPIITHWQPLPSPPKESK